MILGVSNADAAVENVAAVVERVRGRTYDSIDVRKGVTQVAFRAKTYENRKGEKKLQVSGDQADFRRFLNGDDETTGALRGAIGTALGLKTKTAAKQ
jgi:hypothetical protein